jgi:hypothetical protein
MATGACGTDCSACRLNLVGMCTTCGSGRSQEGCKKLNAQHRMLGAPCPVLACAIEPRVAYCSNIAANSRAMRSGHGRILFKELSEREQV